jgi:hypothetical protein
MSTVRNDHLGNDDHTVSAGFPAYSWTWVRAPGTVTLAGMHTDDVLVGLVIRMTLMSDRNLIFTDRQGTLVTASHHCVADIS